MIATPLAPRGGRLRRLLSSVVVSGLCATTASATARRWGGPRTAAAAVTVSGATALVERIGTATGVPFGRYHYTAALRPQVGGVPAIVPLAWFAMAVPAREAAHAALGARSNRLTRVLLGAVALTAWDLFLDPQMVGEGYWRWARRGRYRGIPVSNFAGWLLTSLGVMASLEVFLPVGAGPVGGGPVGAGPVRGSDGSGAAGADPMLVAEYGMMAAMETVGFAVFFRDRLVAGVGGAAMLPIAIAAVRRVRWTRG